MCHGTPQLNVFFFRGIQNQVSYDIINGVKESKIFNVSSRECIMLVWISHKRGIYTEISIRSRDKHKWSIV